MGKNRKTSFRAYPAWNYEKELEDLNRASEQGWQLVKGGCFHSKFVKKPELRYRYQLDFGRIEDMGRYIETFREQGWEYINSTFNNWHFFRKAWDPALPEEAYEIFTDRDSLREMHNRWSNIALIVGLVLAAAAGLWSYWMITKPQLPTLIQLLTFTVESAVLLRGVWIMRNPDHSRARWKNGSAFMATFVSVILLGCAVSTTLTVLRPSFSTKQQAGDIENPIFDNRWVDFTVKYPDSYYLDLEIQSEKPLTFSVLNEAGEAVYTATETNFREVDIRLTLTPGKYEFSMSCETSFQIDAAIE